ncbi:MAG: GDSL-type esterase/lipase family protein [Candidatus Izemoplasma sp.]
MEEWNYKEHYKLRLKEIGSKETKKDQVIIVGDSIIERFDLMKFFPDLTIYNHGIRGDETPDLLDSIFRRAIKYKPKKLFISIGTNDIGNSHNNVKDIYNNIVSIVNEVKNRSKDTEIHLVSVVPVNTANKSFIVREFVDSRDNFDINLLNYYLKNFARKNKFKFVDITKGLKNNLDQLNIEYTTDGLHLNENGYQVFSDILRAYVY